MILIHNFSIFWRYLKPCWNIYDNILLSSVICMIYPVLVKSWSSSKICKNYYFIEHLQSLDIFCWSFYRVQIQYCRYYYHYKSYVQNKFCYQMYFILTKVSFDFIPVHSGKVWGQTRLLYIGSVDSTFVMVDSPIMI